MMLAQLRRKNRRRPRRLVDLKLSDMNFDDLAWNAVQINPNNFVHLVELKIREMPRVRKIWMSGKIYYKTPKGYLIPEELWVLNKEKFLKMIEEGEL